MKAYGLQSNIDKNEANNRRISFLGLHLKKMRTSTMQSVKRLEELQKK